MKRFMKAYLQELKIGSVGFLLGATLGIIVSNSFTGETSVLPMAIGLFVFFLVLAAMSTLLDMKAGLV